MENIKQAISWRRLARGFWNGLTGAYQRAIAFLANVLLQTQYGTLPPPILSRSLGTVSIPRNPTKISLADPSKWDDERMDDMLLFAQACPHLFIAEIRIECIRGMIHSGTNYLLSNFDIDDYMDWVLAEGTLTELQWECEKQMLFRENE